MSTTSAPNEDSLNGATENPNSVQLLSAAPDSSSRADFAPYNCLPAVCAAPSNMSAAAAAALLLQAASNASVNGEAPSRRRCSITNILESPQHSPSFPHNMLSVAAHQAALAAAQSIGTTSAPSPSISTDLQAAMLSLAFAANNPSTELPSVSQAVTDFLFLSERHPELLASQSSLASVLRRRSSTVLPELFSETNSGSAAETLDPLHYGNDPGGVSHSLPMKHTSNMDSVESVLSNTVSFSFIIIYL